MHVKIQIVGWSVIGIILLVSIEFTAYLAYRLVVVPRARFLIYDPPRELDREEYDRYLRVRDTILGWPTTERLGSGMHDSTGSRPVPAFPEPGDECVSLYGDSFVYAEGVDDSAAWGNVLAEMLGCRVSNFGAGGYGTDQALLRFEHNIDDEAPVSILGIFPHNVLRNVNQHRYLIAGAEPWSFKPRYAVEDDGLRLVPLTEIQFDQLDWFFRDPSAFLAHETFLPGSSQGGSAFHFPTRCRCSDRCSRSASPTGSRASLPGFRSWSPIIPAGPRW
jgi:hypothetical protein